MGPDDLLFATREGTPISRNTFRTRVWLPAVRASGVEFDVRVHDLRHAHASWLLAGGSDLKSVMDRMGHAQITTTQKYLHALPDADQKNLDALNRIRARAHHPDDGTTSEKPRYSASTGARSDSRSGGVPSSCRSSTRGSASRSTARRRGSSGSSRST